MEKEAETHAHPSFGQIQFSRIQGTQNFYGSELQQEHYIEMTLRNSEIKRDLTKDWYYTKGLPLARIRMTSGQFSEMITSLNMGEGVCCTIEMINEKEVDKLAVQESRKEFIHRKFKDRMKMFANTIREQKQKAKIIIQKKTLSRQDILDLTNHLDWLTQEMESNIPFFAECFQETMDEIVFEAKTEVENAIQHKISVLGLQKLHEENKLLK